MRLEAMEEQRREREMIAQAKRELTERKQREAKAKSEMEL